MTRPAVAAAGFATAQPVLRTERQDRE